MISWGHLWRLLKCDVKRGWSASYEDYKIKPLITNWTWPQEMLISSRLTKSRMIDLMRRWSGSND